MFYHFSFLLRLSLVFGLWGCWLSGGSEVQAQALPDSLRAEFSDQLVSYWPFLVGYQFDEQGRMYAFSKDGKVWLSPDGQKPEQPLLDISEEVANFGDHGLIGFTLDPAFARNGYFYLLYTVDRHHLLYHGTPAYDPRKNDHKYPSIGRLLRYQADPATHFTTVLPESRTVLMGRSLADGIPLLHNSHGLGSLVFGEDGTLLVSVGDGASYTDVDVGGDEGGALAEQALREGIIDPRQDVGAFRSQLIHSLNGKILRIDPKTGAGVSSNPFYDPAQPRAAQSRVWALGFRNPYRFRVIPGTGDHNPARGRPGELLVSEVGWGEWEEWNRVEKGGQNFGWPLYEGLDDRWQYYYQRIYNRSAPNPAYDGLSCTEEYLAFNDLIVNPRAGCEPVFPNPCRSFEKIPDSFPRFVHEPPLLTYRNGPDGSTDFRTFVPGFDAEGRLTGIALDDADSGVEGKQFNGICTNGGVWYDGDNFPADYRGKYFMADYKGWIKLLAFDNLTHELQAVEPFMERSNGPARPIWLAVDPASGCLWYTDYHADRSMLRRICYGGNPVPRARIEVARTYGASPFTVAFAGQGSSDPNGQVVRYAWDFGDGDQSQVPNPTHTFEAEGPQSFTVTLTVTDDEGATHQAQQLISVNNTPPQVQITSVADSGQYPLRGITHLPLAAQVDDAEQGEERLFFQWQVILHHNSHTHPEAVDTARTPSAIIVPEGCGDETFWYRIVLRVQDPLGLEGRDEVEIFPYCGPEVNRFDSVAAGYRDHTGTTLHWQMAEEEAGTTYYIERSADKLSFDILGQQAADGSLRYTWTDVDHDATSPYYRLRAVSADSIVSHSPVAKAVFLDKPDIWVYPNPARERLWVELKEAEGRVTLEILDLHGRILTRSAWPGAGQQLRYSMVLDTLSSGLYLYRISDGKQVETGRFMKR